MNDLKQIFKTATLLMMSFSVLFVVSCNNDGEDDPQPTGTSTEFTLSGVSDSGVSGTATFELLDNDATRITLSLTGTSADGDHPSHIHMNSAAKGGGIVLDLSNVDGASGESVTDVTALNDGTAVTYDDLISFDGYINVHNSANDLGTLVAQGDIGVNVLTGESESYGLSELNDSGLSGTATFSERVSGESLVEITLMGDANDSNHPAHIHLNSAAEGGGIAISLTNVVGGSSKTHVDALDNGTAITYDELLLFDGYVNIHNSPEDLGTFVAQGDIGQNALTGESETYTLNEVHVAGITGTATFSERVSGATLVEINLSGAPAESNYPSHIHNNSAVEGGGIAIDLSNVAGGSSKTHIDTLNDGSAITYAELIAFDGYINVHKSDFSGLVAQGNIGANAGAGNESINYDVTATSSTDYTFNGNGQTDATDPDLTLQRGQTYTFTVNAPGHPFWIKSVQSNGNGDAYNDGVTGNGATDGTVTFEVPNDAPDQLFYNCEFHASMTGTFNITD